MDIPAIQVVKNNDNHQDNIVHLSEACELYLRLKGVGKDKVFIRTANRNTGYVAKLLGDRAYTHGNHLTFLTVSIFWLLYLTLSNSSPIAKPIRTGNPVQRIMAFN